MFEIGPGAVEVPAAGETHSSVELFCDSSQGGNESLPAADLTSTLANAAAKAA